MRRKPDDTAHTPELGQPRKAYKAPSLVRYGDVAHLTRTVGPPGKLKDNPNIAKTRTV
jgi:hypothetical protein